MLGRVLKEVRMPLPDDFFPRLKVSQELQSAYHRAAAELLQASLIAEAAPLTRAHPAQLPDHWKLIGERSGLRLYRERGADRGTALQVIVLGTLPGALEDVMWGLYAASVGALKTQRSIMHKDYLDAALLHVLDEDPATEGDPSFAFRFAGLKWLACAPTGKLVHKRDVCWHEELGLTPDANGNEVGFLTMHSVRVAECPPLEQQGVKRSNVSVAYIFRDLGDGRTGVYMKGTHLVGGKSRSWSSDAVMAEMWLAMANVLECAQSKRLTRLVGSKEPFVASQAGKTCEMCDQKLKMLKGGQNCKGCGKNVCDRCRMTRLIYPTRNDAAFPCSFLFCKRCLIDAKDQPYAKVRRLSYQSDLSSQRSNSPRFRSASNGSRSVYSSSSSTDSYRGGATSGSHRDRTVFRDQFQQHQRQPYYSDVKVKHLSPRSSTGTALSGAPTTISESSCSDSLGSSYPRGDAAVSSHSSSHSLHSYRPLQNRRHPALSTTSSTSSTSGSVKGDHRGAPPPPMQSLRRNISNSSAISQLSNRSLPQRQLSQRSFESSVGSASEAGFSHAQTGGSGYQHDSDDSDSDSSSEDSSSGLSESDNDDDNEEAEASSVVAVVQYQTQATAPKKQLSPNAKVLAKLRQIEMFADDETGLVQLPPSRRISSQQSPHYLQHHHHPVIALNSSGVSSNTFQGDRLKYISTNQANKNGGIGTHATEPSHSAHASFANRGGGYGNAGCAAGAFATSSSSDSASNGYPGYASTAGYPTYTANFSGARGSPYPGAPSPSTAPSYSQQQLEREQMRERLMQINKTAEATYLMAKYYHGGGLSDYSNVSTNRSTGGP